MFHLRNHMIYATYKFEPCSLDGMNIFLFLYLSGVAVLESMERVQRHLWWRSGGSQPRMWGRGRCSGGLCRRCTRFITDTRMQRGGVPRRWVKQEIQILVVHAELVCLKFGFTNMSTDELTLADVRSSADILLIHRRQHLYRFSIFTPFCSFTEQTAPSKHYHEFL